MARRASSRPCQCCPGTVTGMNRSRADGDASPGQALLLRTRNETDMKRGADWLFLRLSVIPPSLQSLQTQCALHCMSLFPFMQVMYGERLSCAFKPRRSGHVVSFHSLRHL
jgi:hypothetical protein